MRNNSQDSTLERNYLEKYRFLIKEYEQVKNKTHPLHKKHLPLKNNRHCRCDLLRRGLKTNARQLNLRDNNTRLVGWFE